MFCPIWTMIINFNDHLISMIILVYCKHHLFPIHVVQYCTYTYTYMYISGCSRTCCVYYVDQALMNTAQHRTDKVLHNTMYSVQMNKKFVQKREKKEQI